MKARFLKIDKPLFFLTLIYTIIGLIMIFSASSVSTVLRYHVAPSYFFIRQLLFVVISTIIGILIILKIPTQKYLYISMLYVLIILALLSFIFIWGKVAGGAQSWYRLGYLNLQPTEFAKSALIIYMATFYEKSIRKKKSFTYQFIPIVIAVLIFGLVAAQPDFGGAMIISGIVFFLFLSVPFEAKSKVHIIRILGIGALLALITLLYSGSEIFNTAQLSRLKFQNPCQRYMEDTGYQVCNGFIAYHNGGLFGVGLGNSTQKYLYLPEAHTDFIFPILVEELGLIVGILIIIGYAYMLYRILKIAKKADSIRNTMICYGTFLYLLMHLIVNLMGSLALIPLTGVPLPFLSYGGSFNMNVIFMIFIVQRVAIENRTNEEKRALSEII